MVCRIPLDFNRVVDGLLAVDPKGPEKPTDEDYERAQGKRKKPTKRSER